VITFLKQLPKTIVSAVIFLGLRLLFLPTLWLATTLRHRNFHTIFARWDAQWYQSIAAHGYGYEVIEKGRTLSNEAFFPLFPLAERLVHAVIRISYIRSGIIVSWFCGAWAAAAIYAVVSKLTNERTALLTVFLWAVYPIAYVDNLAYSETLFTALVATAIMFLQKKRMLLASVFAALAGLTRPTGLAVGAAVTLTILLELWRYPVARKSWLSYLAMLLPITGWLGFVIYLAKKNHSLLSYFHVQSHWGNGFDGGVHFVKWIAHYLLSRDFVIGLLLIALCTALIYLLLSLYRAVDYLPVLIFTTLLVALSFCTQGYFGSKPRYLLPAFPLLIPIAQFLADKRSYIRWICYGVLVLLGMSYGAIAATGHGPP